MLVFAFALMLGQITAPAAPSDAPPTKTQDPDQRIRCKDQQVTGSLAARRRVCHTVAEWRIADDSASSEAQKLVDRGVVSASNGTLGSTDLEGYRGH